MVGPPDDTGVLVVDARLLPCPAALTLASLSPVVCSSARPGLYTFYVRRSLTDIVTQAITGVADNGATYIVTTDTQAADTQAAKVPCVQTVPYYVTKAFFTITYSSANSISFGQAGSPLGPLPSGVPTKAYDLSYTMANNFTILSSVAGQSTCTIIRSLPNFVNAVVNGSLNLPSASNPSVNENATVIFDPAFKPGTMNYSVNLPFTYLSVTFMPRWLSDTDCSPQTTVFAALECVTIDRGTPAVTPVYINNGGMSAPQTLVVGVNILRLVSRLDGNYTFYITRAPADVSAERRLRASIAPRYSVLMGVDCLCRAFCL
jgi:hypothetical protein